ncbi:MAG: DMT family transporter [Treponemataceae bacterium]|nr:DMT family transporter [Treponemataceae bacterium]
MKNQKTEQLKGFLAIALCAFLWSTSGLLIKLIPWHPMIIAGGRSFIAFFFILLNLRRSSPPLDSAESKEEEGSSSPLHRSFFWAGLFYGLTMILFVIANKLTASANVILLQYSAPIWAAIFGWKLAHEPPRWEHGIALILVMAGLILFFKEGFGGGSPLGDLLALLSGICFALYSVYMRLQRKGKPEYSLLLSHAMTALAGFPFLFLVPPSMTGLSIVALSALGIFQIGIASLLFAYGIRRVTALQAMLTAMIEPVFNPLWVFLGTGEVPGTGALAGGPLILVAVIGSAMVGMYRGKKAENNRKGD